MSNTPNIDIKETKEDDIKNISVVNVDDLIREFEDMANRGSLLTGGIVPQQDLLMQIIGTIYKVTYKNKQEPIRSDYLSSFVGYITND